VKGFYKELGLKDVPFYQKKSTISINGREERKRETCGEEEKIVGISSSNGR